MISEESDAWGSRLMFIMVVICQLIGISNIDSIPNNAIMQGTTGYTIFLILLYIFLGIPLLYMEAAVSQFTKRDCIEVWNIRPCLSFMGYILCVWQAIALIYNQIVTSFLIHYLLISFENPIPFYTCGPFRTKYCDSLVKNYTVNHNCIKYQGQYSYCETLYKTFPEYQYWRYNLLKGRGNREYYIAWRVCVASGLNCFILYLSCFKRLKTLRWFAISFTLYSMLALLIVLMGSMRQKGIVAKYEESLDLDFSEFSEKFRLSNLIQQIVYNLNIGSGTMFTLTSTLTFRSPCFSDVVISITVCTLYTVLFVIVIAMMTCPYAFEYGLQTGAMMKTPMSLNFVKIPRLINMYKYKTFYLIIIFSCEAVLGLATMAVYLFTLLEVVFKRCPKLANYPGLTGFCFVLSLFCITIPFLSFYGIDVIAQSFRRNVTLLSTFIGLVEGFVFIFWYGVNRFSEDIHFMLGIKPKSFMKATWTVSIILLTYTFINELYQQFTFENHHIIATYSFVGILCFIVTIFVTKLLIAACRKRFGQCISLDPTWGPRSDVLQRSRAMFSAQAMTKEYIYRQYHLQAGIMARQRRANRVVNFRVL